MKDITVTDDTAEFLNQLRIELHENTTPPDRKLSYSETLAWVQTELARRYASRRVADIPCLSDDIDDLPTTPAEDVALELVDGVWRDVSE